MNEEPTLSLISPSHALRLPFSVCRLLPFIHSPGRSLVLRPTFPPTPFGRNE